MTLRVVFLKDGSRTFIHQFPDLWVEGLPRMVTFFLCRVLSPLRASLPTAEQASTEGASLQEGNQQQNRELSPSASAELRREMRDAARGHHEQMLQVTFSMVAWELFLLAWFLSTANEFHKDK
jgi:hypothetical protein